MLLLQLLLVVVDVVKRNPRQLLMRGVNEGEMGRERERER